jgi:hypothetical protein
MRYEMIRLAQLVFALALMFGAFIGGLTIGWLRWGRRPDAPATEEARDVPRPEPVVPRLVKRDLFSPETEGGTVDLTDGATFSPAALAAPALAPSEAPGVPR